MSNQNRERKDTSKIAKKKGKLMEIFDLALLLVSLELTF
jgi:hypothetical protein